MLGDGNSLHGLSPPSCCTTCFLELPQSPVSGAVSGNMAVKYSAHLFLEINVKIWSKGPGTKLSVIKTQKYPDTFLSL